MGGTGASRCSASAGRQCCPLRASRACASHVVCAACCAAPAALTPPSAGGTQKLARRRACKQPRRLASLAEAPLAGVRPPGTQPAPSVSPSPSSSPFTHSPQHVVHTCCAHKYITPPNTNQCHPRALQCLAAHMSTAERIQYGRVHMHSVRLCALYSTAMRAGARRDGDRSWDRRAPLLRIRGPPRALRLRLRCVDPHNMDCPPTRWPESPRIVLQWLALAFALPCAALQCVALRCALRGAVRSVVLCVDRCCAVLSCAVLHVRVLACVCAGCVCSDVCCVCVAGSVCACSRHCTCVCAAVRAA